MKNINCGKSVSRNTAGDLRGTAYVTEAAKPFKGNGVSSNAVFGGDLRAKGGQKSGAVK